MSYKLYEFGVIRLRDGASFQEDADNADWREYQDWLAAGGVPEAADVPTPAQVAKELEITQANPTARAYFAASPAAVAFIRLSPTDQATQIDAMTLAQLKVVVRYLAVAVSALIKRELL